MRSPLTQCKTEELTAIALLKEACQQEDKYSAFACICIEPYLPS
jgi:hypothetical protein